MPVQCFRNVSLTRSFSICGRAWPMMPTSKLPALQAEMTSRRSRARITLWPAFLRMVFLVARTASLIPTWITFAIWLSRVRADSTLRRSLVASKPSGAGQQGGQKADKTSAWRLELLKLKKIRTHIQGLQKLYASVRFRPAPPSFQSLARHQYNLPKLL